MAEDMFPKPSVGRMIHYRENTHCVAGLVTAVDNEEIEEISALLAPAGENPIPRTNIPKGSAGTPGTWHWPERV